MREIPKIKLFNTLSRTVEELKPIQSGNVKIYCCGPTVYKYVHLGNHKTYLFEDLLVRTLRYSGLKVTHVMNITDVGHLVSDADDGEDKMALAARTEKKKSFEIAEYYTKAFFDDCTKLNIITPSVVCKATDHIAEMITLIQRIEENGYTYIAGGNVCFDVSKSKEYGRLAQLDLEKLEAGARIDVDKSKRNPQDFVLWFTKSKFENQELQWDSPWGKGYPGWHIECSAMAMKYLGDEFDIHCGGIDLCPVHHCNEIAQSEAATGRQWVRHWMHGEFLLAHGDKMSKSKGAFLVLNDLPAQGIDPIAYRLLCLGAHYRSQLNFTWEGIQNAANSLKSLKNTVLALKREQQGSPTLSSVSKAGEEYILKFNEAIFNDLNAPQALATTWSMLSDKAITSAERLTLISKFDAVLGLGIDGWQEESVEVPAEVQELAQKRELARKAKDWKAADEYRTKIAELGFILEDSAQGIKFRRK